MDSLPVDKSEEALAERFAANHGLLATIERQERELEEKTKLLAAAKHPGFKRSQYRTFGNEVWCLACGVDHQRREHCPVLQALEEARA